MREEKNIYLMPDEKGVWHEVEAIFWEEGKEIEAINKAFNMGIKEGRKNAESNKIVDALIELGYPHNFQGERSDLVDYMYAVTDIIKKAYRIKEHNE